MSSTWSEFPRVGKWLRATNSTGIPAAWRMSSSEETIWSADPMSVVRPNSRSQCFSVNSGAAGGGPERVADTSMSEYFHIICQRCFVYRFSASASESAGSITE